MQSESQRKGYLMRSLGMSTNVLNRLVFNQPVDNFITDMLKELITLSEITVGKPALCALLEVIRSDVGEDVKVSVDELLRQIREELKKQQPPSGIWKCLHTLDEHSGSVESVAISPDGQTLINSGNFEAADGNIKLWDVSTGKLKRTLAQGLSNFGFFSLAISPDGNTLAIGQYGAVKLWNFHTGEELNILWAGHARQVNSLAFSSDGQFLVAGCSLSDINIWDWRNQNLLRTINQTSDWIGFVTSLVLKVLWCVAISPNGQVIASGGENLPLALWNFDSGTIWRTLPKSKAKVCSVAFSPDGQILASGSQDNTIRIWNIHTGDLLYTFNHSGEVNCVAFSPDGKTLVSADNAGIIKVWRVFI